MSVFEVDEYKRRIEQTKKEMLARHLDVLLITSPENINYLTGYEGWSFYTHQLLALDLGSDEPVLFLRDMDIPCAALTTFLQPGSVVGYAEDWIGVHGRHVMGHIGQVLRGRGLGRGRIGVEKDTPYFTAKCQEELERTLISAELVDATLLVNWIRTVKSAAEIACMREAAAIADRGMAAVTEHIRPGVRECDAAAAGMAALVEGTGEAGGGLPITLLVMPGKRTAAPHLDWTDEPFPAQTTVNIELGGCRHRYHAGLARTMVLGRPSDAIRALSHVVSEGLEAARSAMRPGETCESVEAAWRAVLARSGLEKESRIGYSIGLGFFPTWVEGTASLQQGDLTTLEPGMTFHLICGMWKGDVNTEMSETVLVTDGEAEVLTSFPRRLVEEGDRP